MTLGCRGKVKQKATPKQETEAEAVIAQVACTNCHTQMSNSGDIFLKTCEALDDHCLWFLVDGPQVAVHSHIQKLMWFWF